VNRDRPAVIVRVYPGAGDDTEKLAELTRRLCGELLDLDVEAVEPLSGTAPDGAKPGSGLATALGVRLGAAALKALLVKIRDWVARNGRDVEITVDGDTFKITNTTVEQQEQLINVFLARHATHP
jgi:hypothetical protein